MEERFNKENFQYIWSLLLNDNGLEKEKIKFVKSRMISPYFELNQKNINDVITEKNKKGYKAEIEKMKKNLQLSIPVMDEIFERLIKKESIKVEKNKDILGYMQKDYAKQYACVQRIIAYISTKYHEPIEGEVIYLLIHIVKLTT